MDLPREFIARMQPLLGSAWPAFAAALDAPRRRGLRVNTLKTDVHTLLPLFPLPLTPAPFAPDVFCLPPERDTPFKAGSDPLHHAGAYYMQEPSATVPAAVLAARPGERVLDLCAAPGGKSTQLAAAMRGKGVLWCNEYVPARARILQQNLERCGVRNAVVSSGDTGRLCRALAGWADAVLVDAPCSGEGMFRKEPQALSGWSIDNIRLCAARQDEILDNAALAVRPGGRLVYSTCTFAPEEDELAVARFLRRHPDFFLVPTANNSKDVSPLSVHADSSCAHTSSVFVPPANNSENVSPLSVHAGSSCVHTDAVFVPPANNSENVSPLSVHTGSSCAHTASAFVPPANSSKNAAPFGQAGFPLSALSAFGTDGIDPAADTTLCRRIFPQHGGEGHFVALLYRAGDAPSADAPYRAPQNDPHAAAARALYAECFTDEPAGTFVTVGETVRLLPPDLPQLTGTGTLSAGLAVADVRRGRAEPCHAAFAAARAADCRRTVDLMPGDPRLAAFLHGEELSVPEAAPGYCAVTVAGIPLGFGKVSGGRLKNRYPKGLRTLG